MKYCIKSTTIFLPKLQLVLGSSLIDFRKTIILTSIFTILNNIAPLSCLAQISGSGSNLSRDRPLVKKLVRRLKEKDRSNLIKSLQLRPEKTSKFLNSPRTVNNKEINPFTTTIILNGTPINHLTNWHVNPGYEFGGDFSDNFVFNGLVKLNGRIEESLTRDNIFTIEQTGQYLQFHTVRQLREVTVAQKQPQTMNGMEMQMSLIAYCLFPGSSSEDLCTYTPGLTTDRNSINQDFLVPTRIIQTSNLGDVVKPETLAAIKQPGFQLGTQDQQLGLDLYFPNIGTTTNDSQANRTSISRTETIDYKPGVTYSRVKQIIKANDKEAALGLTIRGWTGIVDDKNTLLNSAIQLGTELLPDAIPQIAGSTRKANKNVNINLLLSARNNWTPINSFTIYQAGIGRAASPKPRAKTQSMRSSSRHAPVANFNSAWIGLSPVTERRYKSHLGYVPTSPQRVMVNAGGEGGATQNVSFVSVANNDIFATPNLDNFYTQIYLKFLEQDVDLTTTAKLKEKTSYYPHISFSGNLTGTEDVLRYYTGIIFADDIKPYIGLDYTKNSRSGWNYQVGAIGYINPDRDYYTHALGNISKTVTLSKTANLVFSTGLDYILDGDDRIDDAITISPESSVTVGAVANIGAVSLGVTNFFGGILPESVDNSLLTSLTIHFSKALHFSAYFSPVNENSSRSRYGASLQWRLGKHKNSPSLSVGWSKYEYEFGKSSFGRDLQTNDDVFTVQLQIGS